MSEHECSDNRLFGVKGAGVNEQSIRSCPTINYFFLAEIVYIRYHCVHTMQHKSQYPLGKAIEVVLVAVLDENEGGAVDRAGDHRG
ncbi:hypothetical protein [Paenibacillus rhizoplanae]|uniref:hypothetical protein n=1 Tax=Paenibacillus rhizoplanae TaxID=1917181 RepID=UPI00362450B1